MCETPEENKKIENKIDSKIANNMVQLGKINLSCSNEKEDCKNKQSFNAKHQDESVSGKFDISEQNCFNNNDKKTHNHLQQPTFSFYTTKNVLDIRFIC